MVFQDPFGSLNPVHRIEHFLTRALVLHGRHATPEALRELMTTVGLTEDMLQSYPHELSGGQRQRVSIARALAVEPRLILADEPTSMLDVSVRVGVLNLMRRLRDERNIAMLYITHDLGSARYLADTTMVMFAGELVEGGDALAIMDAPAHPYTRLLLSAVPDPERAAVERAELPRGDPPPHVLPLRRRRRVQSHRARPPHGRRRRRTAPLGALPSARTRLRHRPPRPEGHRPAGRRGHRRHRESGDHRRMTHDLTLPSGSHIAEGLPRTRPARPPPPPLPLHLARRLLQRPEPAEPLERHLPPLLPVQPARRRPPPHPLGPRHQYRPRALGR